MRLSKRLKVGGAEDLDLIVNRALPGVRLTYVARPPSVLPVRPDSRGNSLESFIKLDERFDAGSKG
ncbi:MAG TPA: type VI secretion system baseplate subunit TssK [Nitrospira sp.]|nr:type VI secretion system baseplate subunit TssK [Nitrospira sp.]